MRCLINVSLILFTLMLRLIVYSSKTAYPQVDNMRVYEWTNANTAAE